MKHKNKGNSAFPIFSKTPNTVYLHEDANGHINEIRIYRGCKAKYDIDWGHEHDGIPMRMPHLHTWVYLKNGEKKRVGGRRLSSKEKKLFEKIMKEIKEENKDA